MNASIALSACSLSRKFSPRKYESGSSLRRPRPRQPPPVSYLAANQPNPKNKGSVSSHQVSNSIIGNWRRPPVRCSDAQPDAGADRGFGRGRRAHRRFRTRRVPQLAVQTGNLATLPEPRGHGREQADEHACGQEDQQEDDQRRTPAQVTDEEAQIDRSGGRERE